MSVVWVCSHFVAVQELKERFVMNLPTWKVKVADKDGVREVEL